MVADTTPRKMLRIIDFIEEQDRPVSADQLLEALGFTRSTLYRHLKVLSESGLVSSISEATYSLGPRIVELDYKIRKNDPLLAHARPLMQKLANREKGIALLCRRYRDRVLCIHQERGTDLLTSNYDRGLARPLFRGAASRVILAHLGTAQIVRLYEENAPEFAAAGLGTDEREVRVTLRRIRRRGWDVTEGQVTPGVVGVASPIIGMEGDVLGSLSLTLVSGSRTADELADLAQAIATSTSQLL